MVTRASGRRVGETPIDQADRRFEEVGVDCVGVDETDDTDAVEQGHHQPGHDGDRVRPGAWGSAPLIGDDGLDGLSLGPVDVGQTGARLGVVDGVEPEFEVERGRGLLQLEIFNRQLHEVPEPVASRDVGGFESGANPGERLGLMVLEHGEEQVLLAREIGVDGSFREAGRRGHLFERRLVEAALGEDLRSGGQQVVPGLAPSTLWGQAVHDDILPYSWVSCILESMSLDGYGGTDRVASAGGGIRAENLKRSFGEVTAVDGVDLTVAPHEIYGFLGPNGAGKSTVVRMLCTLLKPTAGRARVAGFDVVADPQAVRIRIGVALQEAALDNLQTGRELLRLQGRLFGLSRAQIERRVLDVLDMVDIGDAIDRRVGGYSGGMKRRLDLAMALIHNPEVLFLDEPTTGLDPASRTTVWEEVSRLNRERGMTIFLTTQYLEEADVLCHRVGIISLGRLVAEGTPHALKRAIGDDLLVAEVVGDDPDISDRLALLPGVRSVTRDGDQLVMRATDGPAVLSPVALCLSESRLEVRSITVRTPTLDDVFLELTGDRIEVGG